MPLILHCEGLSSWLERKRPMTLMRSLSFKRPPPRTSAVPLMRYRARRASLREQAPTPKVKLVQNGASSSSHEGCQTRCLTGWENPCEFPKKPIQPDTRPDPVVFDMIMSNKSIAQRMVVT